MSLAPGTRLGAYEITAPLGAGGMGEVYRARDTKLNRDVAIKVLPEAFANDPERLARFKREAQVLASLNHPHIAAIYGLEDTATASALILELVEGPTLADRIAQGPIPLDEALPIAKQICEAMEAAHERGVIHRDLKPANIKLTPDGTVKVLDFGLAKAMLPDPSSPSHVALTHSPTITSPIAMSGVGVLLGTASYMSPEQARGKPVDKRTDIWALGCVLYEMLTGRVAFDGAEVTDVLARVIEREADVAALPTHTPAPIRRLLRRCLEKDRKRRLADALDARLEIEDAMTAPASDLAATSAIPSRGGWRQLAPIMAGVLVGGTLAGGAVWFALRPVPSRVTRTTIQTSGETALVNIAALVNIQNRSLDITPDGSAIVYSGDGRLLMRRLDQLEATPLVQGGSPTEPFVSADGRWVGFFDGPALKQVAITGGPPVTLVSNTITGSGGPMGATRNAEGIIVFATNTTRGLRRIQAPGGAADVLTRPNEGNNELRHSWPEFLPDGRSLLFTIVKGGGGPASTDIALLDLAAGTHTVLIRGGSSARYLPTGHLLYRVGDTWMAIRFDLKRRAVVGTSVPVPGIEPGALNLDVAVDGTLVYVPSGGTPGTRLVWVDRQGREEVLRAPVRRYFHPRLSPDGTRVAILSYDPHPNRGLFLWDLAGARLSPAIPGEASGTLPLWTHDSERLIFSAAAGPADSPSLRMRATDGTGTTTQLTRSVNPQHPTGITPDSGQIIFYEMTPSQERDIQLLTLRPEPHVSPLIATRYDEGGGVVSPNGRWLAYESNSRGGAHEVYVVPFPAVGARLLQVSSGGGIQPLWARNGRELFYMTPDGTLMATPVDTQASTFFHGAPTRVGGPYNRGAGIAPARQYDVSLDGQRFLMIKEEARNTEAGTSIIIVQNWFEELKRVPIN